MQTASVCCCRTRSGICEAGQRHIGIYNCLRRVELFYGNEGKIEFSSAVGGGTQVYLVIPLVLPADCMDNREVRI